MVRLPWESSAPCYAPAWSMANKHQASLNQTNPPQLPKPKDPTPTLKELRPQENSSKVRCFNNDLQKEILRAAAETDPDVDQLSSFDSKPLKKKGISSSVGFDMDTISAMASKQRLDAIVAVRQQEDLQRSNALHAKMKAAAKAKEDNFLATYGTLQSEHETFVADLDKYLEIKRKAREEKERTLHSDWKECVFDKIQSQLLTRVEEMDAEEIGRKRRELFQNYIDAARRKGGRLFLDIVIENEYDPFTWKKGTLKYRSKPAVLSNGAGFTDRFGNPIFDPLSRDLDKLKSEGRAAQEVAGIAASNHPESLGREILGHEHWSKMEATPFYDRAAKVQDAIASGKTLAVRNVTHSKVDVDDFNIEKDYTVLAKEFQGLYGMGKRVWKDWQPGTSVHTATRSGLETARPSKNLLA